MAEKQIQFKFRGYRVTKSEIRLSPDGEIDKRLNVTFSGVRSAENGSDYTLDLGVSVANEDNSISVELEMRGFFEFDQALSMEQKWDFFSASAPAIMFPYLRAHISTLTAISGVEALVLPTINFAEGLRRAEVVE